MFVIYCSYEKHLQKIDVLTDVKHKQINKVMERIIDGINEQLRINPSVIIPEMEENMVDITTLMILTVITLVVYLDFAHQLICNDFR